MSARTSLPAGPGGVGGRSLARRRNKSDEKAAIQRRENLTRSADELRVQLEDAKGLLSEAFEELKKVELLDERDQARERAEESAREQADMDSIGLMRARLGGAIA